MTPPRARRHPDENDIRVRPNRRGSRPRSKDRPEHAQARIGQVITVDRGRFGVLLDGFGLSSVVVTAMKARELGRKSVVVGDRVFLVGDLSGEVGSLARIVRVDPRTTLLRRSADDTDPVERGIVANADQLAVVVALTDPTPRPRLIDRCLVAAYDAGLEPLLILTKADLCPPEEFLARYTPLEVPAIVTRRDADQDIVGAEEVRKALQDRVTVFVGHSGVGKSTLVNALVPGAGRATGRVNDVTGRGRHTSTSAIALEVPGTGWVVDTPGVRSFGLAHVEPGTLLKAFPDLLPGQDSCPRGCSHDEPECGLDAWVASGAAGAAGAGRLLSLRLLLRSRNEDGQDRDGQYPDSQDRDGQYPDGQGGDGHHHDGLNQSSSP